MFEEKLRKYEKDLKGAQEKADQKEKEAKRLSKIEKDMVNQLADTQHRLKKMEARHEKAKKYSKELEDNIIK